MDPVITKALKKLRELDLERDRIEQFIATYETLSGTKVVRDDILAKTTPVEQNENTSGTSVAPKRKRASPGQIADMAERIIIELNRPLTRGEIVEELERRDIVIESGDKGKYVGTILWRQKDRFRNVEGSGYWLASKPFPTDSKPSVKEPDIFS